MHFLTNAAYDALVAKAERFSAERIRNVGLRAKNHELANEVMKLKAELRPLKATRAKQDAGRIKATAAAAAKRRSNPAPRPSRRAVPAAAPIHA